MHVLISIIENDWENKKQTKNLNTNELNRSSSFKNQSPSPSQWSDRRQRSISPIWNDDQLKLKICSDKNEINQKGSIFVIFFFIMFIHNSFHIRIFRHMYKGMDIWQATKNKTKTKIKEKKNKTEKQNRTEQNKTKNEVLPV